MRLITMSHYELRHNYTEDEIKSLNKDEQIELMEQWFREYYEDPVNSCPYESAEGGYIYIWGGPHEARDVLYDEFQETIAEDVIEELIDKLDNECTEWSEIPPPSYEPEDYKSIFENESAPFETLEKMLDVLKKIIDSNANDENEQTIYNMVLVHLITSLETFLSDFFIVQIKNHSEYIKEFVRNYKEYKEISVPLSEVYVTYEKMNDKVFEDLRNIVWHNLAKINHLYKVTFGLNFPKDIGHLYKMISIRHDIVHRCGKSKDGVIHTITRKDLQLTYDEIIKLATEINEILPKF
jgi:hypothetical protein